METETTLSRVGRIWTELLNVPGVGDADHFVEMGGDSIAAMMCVARIAAEFGVDIPVATLFLDDTTLRVLADIIDSAIAAPAAAADAAAL